MCRCLGWVVLILRFLGIFKERFIGELVVLVFSFGMR